MNFLHKKKHSSSGLILCNNLWFSEQVSNQRRFTEDESCHQFSPWFRPFTLFCSECQICQIVGQIHYRVCLSSHKVQFYFIYFFSVICFVLIWSSRIRSSAVLLLNSTAGNTDSYAQGAMVSSTYVTYWIFIVGWKRSYRPCYGWPTWHPWDSRRKRRTGDSMHLSSAFFLHIVYLSSLNVSLCFCIRVRLALMDIKETEENQAWRSEQIDVCDSWFIVMSSCIFYSAIRVSHWMLKIISNDTRTGCISFYS